MFYAALGIGGIEYEQSGNLIDYEPEKQLRELICDLTNQKYGAVALVDGKVQGFLAFYGPFDEFQGKAQGVFSPLGASAFAGPDRGKLASRLYAYVAEILVEDGVFAHALSRYAHDEEVGKSFVYNGFGIRCSDIILKLADWTRMDQSISSYHITELIGEEKKLALPLQHKLDRHMEIAPIFYPCGLTDDEKWMRNSAVRVFAAMDGDTVIGFMQMRDEAETFVTKDESMMNICGAYVEPPYRNTGVAVQLLSHLCKVCKKDGMKYLGVDFETINPTALWFWHKYFESYTYSYVRRIDERINEYKELIDCQMQ